MGKRAVSIIIKDSRILLMHRIKNGQEYFVFPGGGVKEGEIIEKAAAREIKEEFDLDIKIEKFLFKIKNKDRYEFYFLVKDFSGTPKISGEEKERMNKKNQYMPVWKNLKEIESLNNLYPLKVKLKILKII